MSATLAHPCLRKSYECDASVRGPGSRRKTLEKTLSRGFSYHRFHRHCDPERSEGETLQPGARKGRAIFYFSC
jgi:hypothetical protein